MGQIRMTAHCARLRIRRQIEQAAAAGQSTPGFLVNRILAPYLMEAMRCVDEGIPPETVDEAALAFGMPMGPIELADTAGSTSPRRRKMLSRARSREEARRVDRGR